MADPPVPPALGIYGAALTVALTASDAEERAAGRRLVHELGDELLKPIRAGRSTHREQPCFRRPLAELIRETLTERLRDDEPFARAA